MSLYILEHVQQIYEQRTILNLPALQIETGEILALVGPNGAGKSTLLRLLAFLEAPTRGNVHLHLENRLMTYQNITVSERRRIAMVFQRPLLLSGSVYDNVAYGLKIRGRRDEKARIEEILDKLSLLHLARAQAATLSGGETQRAALARTLVLQPEILLLDEPTANLDPYNVRLIEKTIQEEHSRYRPTIIIVTHNIFQAKRLATQVAFLLEGELIEIGSPSQFFDTPQDVRTQAFLSGDLVC